MTPAVPRPHPWSDLGCAPRELCQAVGQLLRGQDEALAGQLVGGSLNPVVFEVLVARHRMGPFLKFRLDDSPLWPVLPRKLQTRITQTAEKQDVLAQRCLAGLEELSRAFHRQQISLVAIKGLEMAQRLYGGVSRRGFWDLDLLVHENDRHRACRLLEHQGFHLKSTVFLSERLSARFTHALDYAKGEVRLDLHWCLSRLPGLRIDSVGLFARAERLDLQGLEVHVLSLEDELAFVLVSVFADIQRGYLRLQSFVDLWALVRQLPGLDWAGFFARRRAERTEAICRGVLGLCLGALGLEAEFPALKQALGVTPSLDEALRILERSPGGRRGKAWAARRLPISRPGYAAWWLVSLPFRTTVSHPRFRRKN